MLKYIILNKLLHCITTDVDGSVVGMNKIDFFSRFLVTHFFDKMMKNAKFLQGIEMNIELKHTAGVLKVNYKT